MEVSRVSFVKENDIFFYILRDTEEIATSTLLKEKINADLLMLKMFRGQSLNVPLPVTGYLDVLQNVINANFKKFK